MDFISLEDVAIRLAVAAGLGAFIGMEREVRGHPAGFRTLMVLCVASALVMIISLRVANTDYANDMIRADPGRIAAQAVSGIGFLGGGVILRMGLTVHGLTTAAVMWAVAGLGLAAGAGFLGDALIAAGIIGLALVILPPIERTLLRSRQILRISASARPNLTEDVTSALRSHGLRIERLEMSEFNEENVEMVVHLRQTAASAKIDPAAVLIGIKGIKTINRGKANK